MRIFSIASVCLFMLGCSQPSKPNGSILIRKGEAGPISTERLYDYYYNNALDSSILTTYTLENRYDCPIALQIPITDDHFEVKIGDQWLSKPNKQFRDMSIIPSGAKLQFVVCPLLYCGKAPNDQQIRFVIPYLTVEDHQTTHSHVFRSEPFVHPCISGSPICDEWRLVMTTNIIDEFRMPNGSLSEVAYVLKWNEDLFLHRKIDHYSVVQNPMEVPIPIKRPYFENCLPRPIRFSNTLSNLSEWEILESVRDQYRVHFLQTNNKFQMVWLVDNWYQPANSSECDPWFEIQ